MAAQVQKFESLMDDMVSSFYEATQQTEKHRRRQLIAITKLQTYFRMYQVLKLFKKKKNASNNIKRVYRAYKARNIFRIKRGKEFQEQQLQFFNQMAKTIQKYFRGYYCRKYKHDFYSRKKYLNYVHQKNEQIRKQQGEYQKTQFLEDQKKKQATARQEFQQLAGNLHHLCSTKTQPGVYNPPYVQNKPQAFNKDIQTHLRQTFKQQYKWKPPTKQDIQYYKKVVRTGNGNYKLQKIGSPSTGNKAIGELQ